MLAEFVRKPTKPNPYRTRAGNEVVWASHRRTARPAEASPTSLRRERPAAAPLYPASLTPVTPGHDL
jgi:hypothetical protein